MEKREFKDAVYSELSNISKALANSNRLEILDLLAQKEYTVEEIAEKTNSTIANTSQHLQTLKAARLVIAHRNGHYIFYKLTDNRVFELWRTLREFGIDRNAEIQRLINDFRKNMGEFKSISIEDFKKKSDMNDYFFLDVRPQEEYDRGYIPNAVSIPIDQLKDRLSELPKKKSIVAYCRGPFCVFADEAIRLLNKNGFKALRLEEGYPDWKLKSKNRSPKRSSKKPKA